MSDLRAILTPINMVVSVVMYVPLFRRIFLRKSTGDFSLFAQACIVGLQASSLVLAALEHAWFLFTYYILQLALTGVLLWIILYYRKGPR